MTTDPDPALERPDAPDPAMPDMPSDPGERSRGRYLYTRDGAPVGVEERFVAGEIAAGVTRVRSTRIAAAPTSRLEVDVRFSTRACDALVRWVGSDPSVVRAASAQYSAAGGSVTATRTIDGVDDGPAVAPGVLYPLMRVFTGPLVVSSVRTGGLDVVVPDVGDPTDPTRFLAPTSSHRTAEIRGEATVAVDGIDHPATAYRWIGGAYGEDGADFVVDDGGLLLSYSVTQPSGRWEVTLAEVTGPWPTPSAWSVIP